MEVFKRDVVICGGGTAGLAAAVAAARAGASVCIVEEDAAIGGAPVDQFIQSFCGGPPQGIYAELVERMKGYADEDCRPGNFRYASYVMAYMDMLRGYPVDICVSQEIVRTQAENGVLAAVESADCRFEGKVFIDATGDGDVAALAGCRCRYGREAAGEFGERFAPEQADGMVQRCTLMYTVHRDPKAPFVPIEKGMAPFNPDEGLCWGPTVVCADTTSRQALSAARAQAMERMPKEVEKWREKGFFVDGIAPRIGVRESRRVEGLHILSYNDVMSRRSYPDGICVVNYNIDPWDPDGNPVHSQKTLASTLVPDYEIPYRCLVNAQVDNLIVAGRCISATHVVNASLRVMGICIPVGQAAGSAAAMTAQSGQPARSIDTAQLRQLLREGGVTVSLDKKAAGQGGEGT